MENDDLIFDEDIGGEDDLEGDGLVPKGTYLVQLSRPKLGDMPQEDKARRLSIRMKILDGLQEGETIFDHVSLPHHSEKPGTRRNRQLMLYRIGIIGKDDMDKKDVSVNYGDLEDVRCKVVVIHDTWNGQTRAKIAFGGYHPADWDGGENKENAESAVDFSGI